MIETTPKLSSSHSRHLALGTLSFAVLPAAIASAVLLLACFGLYLFVEGVDWETRRP